MKAKVAASASTSAGLNLWEPEWFTLMYSKPEKLIAKNTKDGPLDLGLLVLS